MPSATIKIVGKKPTPEQKKALFEQTTNLMVDVLQRTRKLVVVSIEEEDSGNWAVGGAELADGKAVGAQALLRILQGANTEEQLAKMVAAMTKMLEEVLGPNALPPYVVFEQIPTNAWGYGGKTIAEIQRARAQAQPQAT